MELIGWDRERPVMYAGIYGSQVFKYEKEKLPFNFAPFGKLIITTNKGQWILDEKSNLSYQHHYHLHHSHSNSNKFHLQNPDRMMKPATIETFSWLDGVIFYSVIDTISYIVEH